MTRTPSAQIKHIAPRASKRSNAEIPSNDDGVWIYSFGDLMSLLLIFFVMLYAISNISEENFNTFKEALRTESKKPEKGQESDAIASDWANDTVAGIPVSVLRKAAEQAGPFAAPQMQAVVGHIQARLREKLPPAVASDEFELAKEKTQEFDTKYQTFATPQTRASTETLTIRIDEAVLWRSGDSKLTTRGRATLSGLIGDFDALTARETLEMAIPASSDRTRTALDGQRLSELRQALEDWFQVQPDKRADLMPRLSIATFWPSEAEQKLSRHLRVRLSRQNRADAGSGESKGVPARLSPQPPMMKGGEPK